MVDTKNKIIQAAIAVWGSDNQATLADISKHLGISSRTLHRHFVGRNDLEVTVYMLLLEEYSSRVKQAVSSQTEDFDKLKALFINDINSAEKYVLFTHLHQTCNASIPNHKQETDAIRTTYFNIFSSLIQSNKIAENLSTQWCELFYVSTIETVIKAMKAGLNEKEYIDIAWNCFWNSIKNNN